MLRLKPISSVRTESATQAAHAVHHEAAPADAMAGEPAAPRARAGESGVRASDSPVVQHWDLLADDDVDRALQALGVGRLPIQPTNPRLQVAGAASMANAQLGDLLVRLSAENDRVLGLHAKQKHVLGQARHARRDREVEVRRSTVNAAGKLDDAVWGDDIYRKYCDVVLLQERVLDELQATLNALERDHAAVSRLIEVRRQEQERDLIDINLPHRRPYSRWSKP